MVAQKEAQIWSLGSQALRIIFWCVRREKMHGSVSHGIVIWAVPGFLTQEIFLVCRVYRCLESTLLHNASPSVTTHESMGHVLVCSGLTYEVTQLCVKVTLSNRGPDIHFVSGNPDNLSEVETETAHFLTHGNVSSRKVLACISRPRTHPINTRLYP
jgi:hypothetical protein